MDIDIDGCMWEVSRTWGAAVAVKAMMGTPGSCCLIMPSRLYAGLKSWPLHAWSQRAIDNVCFGMIGIYGMSGRIVHN